MGNQMKITTYLFTLALALTPTLAQAAAEMAGKIGYMNGALVAQRVDGTVKVLAPQSEVYPGDMLITARGSYAQVLLNDGTKMTMRPDSNLRIEAFQFREETPQADNMVLRLLKGGFRTVTGLIGKRGNLDAYKVRAATATIGVRGTDFSARLCASTDCLDDAGTSTPDPVSTQAPTPQAIGRVMLVQGEFAARDVSGNERKLLLGGPVYEGDTLITANKTYAVVAFRDESRISLQANTQFQVEKFKYDKVNAEENAVMKLLRGGVRVVTGLIGRLNHDDYKFKMATATIGIRGTGFDAWCNGPCARGVGNPGATADQPLDGAGVYVWAGEVALTSPAGSYIVTIQEAAIISRATGKPERVLAVPPAIINNITPRPDSIPLDMEKLFGSEASAGEPGLYVTVHEGQVILAQGVNTLDMGNGESGFTNERMLIRLQAVPGFMAADMTIDLSSSPASGMSTAGCTIN